MTMTLRAELMHDWSGFEDELDGDRGDIKMPVQFPDPADGIVLHLMVIHPSTSIGRRIELFVRADEITPLLKIFREEAIRARCQRLED
jgi:hypothetical protein